MRSFETAPINAAFFFEMAFLAPIKLVAGLCLVVLILWVIFRSADGGNNVRSIKNTPYVIFLICKAITYGFLFLLVFFFDFSARVWVWKFPEEMPLNSAFVGVLAAYEMISGLASAFQAFIENNS